VAEDIQALRQRQAVLAAVALAKQRVEPQQPEQRILAVVVVVVAAHLL
jgi:hypothetical protein